MPTLKVTTKALDGLRRAHDDVAVQWRDADRRHHGEHPTVKALWARKSERWEAMKEVMAPLDEAIEDELETVNGRSESFTITSARAVRDIADAAEKRLADAGVPVAQRVGAVVAYRPNGPSASAYKYAARTTRITLRRVKDGWRLVGVARSDVWPREPEVFTITIGPDVADTVAKHALKPFTVAGERHAA